MGKTDSQRRFEQRVRQRIAKAHSAAPARSGGGWEVACSAPGCDRIFVTPTRQRKYCGEKCRRAVEAIAQLRQERLSELLLNVCAAEGCAERFIPRTRAHIFCSASCRKRAHRQAGDLEVRRCAECKIELHGRTTRAEYCSTACRVRAYRNLKSNNKEI